MARFLIGGSTFSITQGLVGTQLVEKAGYDENASDAATDEAAVLAAHTFSPPAITLASFGAEP